jgi:hypothetical protein
VSTHGVVRAAAAKGVGERWGDLLFDGGRCSRPLTWWDLAATDALEREARALRPSAGQSKADRGLLRTWERLWGTQP